MPPKQIFKEQIFCFSGQFSKSHDEISEVVEKHGGKTASAMSTRVTHLIATADEVKRKPRPTKVEKALYEEIPIVNIDFINDSVAQGKLVDEEKYSLRPDDWKEEEEMDEEFEEMDESSESETDKVTPKKRKTSSTGVAESGKRQKTDTKEEKPVKKTKPEGSKAKSASKKVPRPKINVEEFLKKTGDIPVTLTTDDGTTLTAQAGPKRFSSGSAGWSFAGKKMKVMVGSQDFIVNVTGNFIIRGTKAKSEVSTEQKPEKEPKAEPTQMDIGISQTPQDNGNSSGFAFQPPPVSTTLPQSEGWGSYLKNCNIQ